jgi:hypothetical protein
MIVGMVHGEGEAIGSLIEALALRSLGARQATLADGRQLPIRVFAGKVVWDDESNRRFST